MTTLGAIGLVMALLLMVSGALYKGPSPDARGMGIMVGLLGFYSTWALCFLPFAFNASRLAPRLRARVCWLGLGLLPLLPVLLLMLAAFR